MSELLALIMRMKADIKLLQACLRLLNRGRHRGLLTEGEAERHYHISNRTLYSLRQKGQLPYIRFCGRIYYRMSDLDDLKKTEDTESHRV